ncbi:MAG: hypothetical protein K6G43_05250 [Lachnospiraceae bacterium]|nr:hypothetical protein [Lachnospiraceae bacterium]
MKKFVKFLLVLLLIVIIVLIILLKMGFGFGGGSGSGSGLVSLVRSDDSAPQTDTDGDGGSGDLTGELPMVVTVTIREDKVYVEDREIGSAEELRSYIESIHTDEREYRLVDENSIRATYEWVYEVFDELEIPLDAK